jgi:hypothetical protein
MMRVLGCFVVVLASAGCARHVVIDPDLVPSKNDRDWRIVSAPSATVSTAAAPRQAPR